MDFKFTLKGKDWFGLYLAALVFYMGPMIGIQIVARFMRADPMATVHLKTFFALYIVMIVSILILIIPITRKIIGGFNLNGTPFAYRGNIVEFVLMVIGNGLLSMITLGIFFPWATRNYVRHIVGRIEYGQSRFSFNGTGLRLFLILLVTIVLPVILFVGLLVLNMSLLQNNKLVFVLAYLCMYACSPIYITYSNGVWITLTKSTPSVSIRLQCPPLFFCCSSCCSR